MKQTNLNIFYHLGASIGDIHNIGTGMTLVELVLALSNPKEWLTAFILETKDVPFEDSCKTAQSLLDAINNYLLPPPSGFDMSRSLSQNDCVTIFGLRDQFEKDFERENHDNIDAYIVQDIGLYKTRKLIECPEKKYSTRARQAFSPEMVCDLQQAGRCLAFDCPTASAFHVFRATEALILAYYKYLAKQDWPDQKHRDWNAYIQALDKLGAPQSITSRLHEIRKFERNPYLHPEKTVSLEEAPVQFDLCTGVIFHMAQEMTK